MVWRCAVWHLGNLAAVCILKLLSAQALCSSKEEKIATRTGCEDVDPDPPGCGCNNKVEVRSPLLQVLQHGIFTHPARPRYHKDTRLRWWNLEVRERNAGDTFTTGTAICMNIAGWQLDMRAPRPSSSCADLGTANHDDSERQVFVMPRPVRCNGDSCCVQHLSTYNRQDAFTSLAQSIYACAPWVVC